MQVTETNTEGLKRAFKIVISASDIDDKIEYRLQELSTRINVPGFRPGKAPMAVLKQRFGGSVRDEVLQQAVKDASQQAIDERGLRPATTPSVEIVSQDEGKDLEYTIDLEVLPDIQPMDFGKIEVERLKVKVSDNEVEQALEQIASGRKQTQPLEKERKAKSGDVLVLDFAGTVDGEALPGMAGEDHHLELGSNSFIQGFEDQLIGIAKGEKKNVKVTFPAEYVNDQLAGREALFDCTVKDILEAVVPPVDENLAKLVGEESLDSLKDKIREQIGQEYDRLARERMKRQMLDQLADAHDFPVPDSMVDAEFEAIWRQVQGDRERGVVDPEDEGKSEEDLQGEYRGIARVRLGLLLAEVGRLNELEVNQEEVTGALYREASRFPGQEQQVVQFYQNNPQAMAQLRAPLFEEKVVDFISELAKVEEREVKADDLKAEEDGGKADTKSAKKPAAKKSSAKAKKPAAKKAAPKGGGAKQKSKTAKAAEAG
jgi:trigger factor